MQASRLLRHHAIVLASCLAATSAIAQQVPEPIPEPIGPPPPQGFVTIMGEGTVAIAPDVATVRFEVISRSGGIKEAVEDNARRAGQVVSALMGAGIPRSQLRTEQYQVIPRKDASQVGYEIRHALTVRVRGLDTLGTIIERATRSGADDVSGPVLSFDENPGAMKEARQRAAKDATERAQAYAQTLGVRLGRIVSVNDSEGTQAGPVPQGEQAVPASVPPIEIARSQVQARVTVVWELAP